MSQLAWGVFAAIGLAGLAVLLAFVLIVCAVSGMWWQFGILAAVATGLIVMMMRMD